MKLIYIAISIICFGLFSCDNSFSKYEKKEKMKRSKLQTVQNFLKYYGSKEEWTEELIGERTEALISLAYNEVWKV